MKKSKQTKLISPTIGGSDILLLLKEDNEVRKKFYRAYYRAYAQDGIMTKIGELPSNESYGAILYGSGRITDLPQPEDNPQYFAHLYKVSLALNSLNLIPNFKSLVKIANKYHSKLRAYTIKRVKGAGGYFPMLSPTQTIGELLLRGWVHELDGKVDPTKYGLRCLIAPLNWPIHYEHHQDACLASQHYGIPGRVGTILPKSKK